MKNNIYRIIDANLNRSREGLRVIEDIVRFCLSDRVFTSRLKKIRHEITNTVKNTDLLLFGRKSDSDVGMEFNRYLEGDKKDIEALLTSNFRRVEESLRVLEDISKLVSPKKPGVYKKLRFRVYTLEKGVHASLRNTR